MLLETAPHELVDARVEVSRQRGEVRVAGQNRSQHVRRRVALKWLAAGEHLIQDAAEGEHVAPVICWKSLGLLGRHVSRRAENHAGLRGHQAQGRRVCRAGCRRRHVGRLGKTEVEHFHTAVGTDHDVGRLQIAVNDALFVCGFQGFRDLSRNLEGVVGGDRPARDPLRERLALDELQDQEGDLADLFEAVDRADVRMIERREDLGLPSEPRQPLRVDREGARQCLDRNGAIQPRVASAVDLAHPASTDAGVNFIDSETGAWRECHVG